MRTKSIVTSLSALLVLGLLLVPLAAAAKGPKVGNGVIHACLKTKGKKTQRGTIRIVSAAKQCKRKKGERPLTWSLLGPSAGGNGADAAAGATGPQGPPGSAGATGPRGEQGPTGQGATVETVLKETIVHQSLEIEQLTTKLQSLTSGVVDLEGTVNGVKGTVAGLGQTVTGLNGTVGDLNGTVGDLKTTTEGLATKVTGQCNVLGSVIKETNEVNGGVGELTGVLKPLLSGFLPKLPTNTPGVTC